jgi:tyrosyl-tRNA synthetase
MSFAEFSYQLLQAQDFAHLYRHAGCTLQLGGSDQYGNIVAGLDLIHRRESAAASSSSSSPSADDRAGGAQQAFGLTTPLLTTSSGDKFGKSAGNAVWLDEQQTSAFDFWQVSPSPP